MYQIIYFSAPPKLSIMKADRICKYFHFTQNKLKIIPHKKGRGKTQAEREYTCEKQIMRMCEKADHLEI